MSNDAPTETERIARLIALLPPVPAHLLRAAQELPATLRALEEIDARVLDDAADRAGQTARLEAALRSAGVEPTHERIAALELELARSRDSGGEGRFPRP